MLQYFVNLNEYLSKRMFIMVVMAVLTGFTLKLPDTPAARTLVVVLFAYMTFVTSLTISFRKFLQVLNKPWIPLWSLFLIHLITPFIAWAVGIVFYPGDFYTRLGYLVCAAIPIGVTSVIWTALNKGNVATSLVTVTLDTLIVPLFMPLYFKIVIGQSLAINYSHMVVDLLGMITVPSLLGIILHDWTNGRVAVFAKSIGGFSSKIGLFIVIVINASLVAPQISLNLAIAKTLLVTLLVVCLGYLLGYVGTYALKDSSPEMAITMIYNVGMRNLSFGLVLALTYFPLATAVPITLGILYQQPIAAFIPLLFNKLKPQPEAC